MYVGIGILALPPFSLANNNFIEKLNLSNRHQVGIVGAGTAGLAAAIAFARLGHDVQVFEKHPALATLGAGLLIQPQGVAALNALGVGDEFSAVSVPINHLLGKNQRNWTIVDVPYRQHEARAVSRAALAHLLMNAALAAGANIRFNAKVENVGADSASGVISVNGEQITCDVLVVADGAASALPKQAGLAVASTPYKWGALWGMFDVDHWPGERRLEQRYLTTRKMFGLMPTARIGDKLRLSLFWSLPCGSYTAWKNTPIDSWKNELLELWPESDPVVCQINSHDQLAFASYYHAHPVDLANPPICVLGDAAHAMSPQLGLGATLALQDGLTLAILVDKYGCYEGELHYAKKRLPIVRAYQILSRALTPCFQADSNGIWRDAMFAAGLFVPGIRKLMYRSVAEAISEDKVELLQRSS